MAVELINRVVGWVGIAWTEFPTNMIGSQAVIVTDSSEGGIGIYDLGGKSVPQVTPISGTQPGFLVSNVCPLVYAPLTVWRFLACVRGGAAAPVADASDGLVRCVLQVDLELLHRASPQNVSCTFAVEC